MDEVRLKDELMARLSNELDRPALQVIDGALSSVLRNYEVAKRETGLSTNIISFPELDIFIGKMRFEKICWMLPKLKYHQTEPYTRYYLPHYF